MKSYNASGCIGGRAPALQLLEGGLAYGGIGGA
jgi:hypothetical protein